MTELIAAEVTLLVTNTLEVLDVPYKRNFMWMPCRSLMLSNIGAVLT